jgi:hypothetical protein
MLHYKDIVIMTLSRGPAEPKGRGPGQRGIAWAGREEKGWGRCGIGGIAQERIGRDEL